MLQLPESANSFYSAESATAYQHTAGLVVLDASEAPDFGFERFRSFLGERFGQIPQLRWKLREVPFGLDRPYWIEDERFSLDRHVHRIAVPSPGDTKTLCELAGYLYSRHLDRSRPLWEIWFIEGLPGRRFALLQKMHHCMMDGQGAQKVGELLSDFEPDPPPRPVHTGLAHATTGATPTELEVYARSIASLARLPARGVREVLSMLRPALLAPRDSHVGRGNKSAVVTPKLACNAVIGAQRGLACTSLPLADVLRVKKRLDVSVNDVLLALTASAMRSYLSRTDGLPLEPLRANIAVSLRKEGDEAVSNVVTSVNVCLHTDVADPFARLAAIHAGADVAKQRARREQTSMYELVNALPPFAASLLTRAMTPDMVLAAMKCNLIVSNVRGSTRPMYMAGASVSAIYPMSLLVTGMGINLTCISYADSVDCGITYEPDLVPHAPRIAEGLREALREYLVLARKPAKAERSPAGRTKVRGTTARERPRRTVGRVARKAVSRSRRP